MGMAEYCLAVDLIEKNGGDFAGPKPESLVEAAEMALDLKFPPTYRRFLMELGCGGIEGNEFYGVINSNFAKSGIPDGIWLTLDERQNTGLSKQYVIVHALGDGTYDAIDTSRVGDDMECPIVLLSPDGKMIEDLSEDFGTFFYETIRDAL